MVQMHSQRSGAGVIALDSCVYVVGGNDGCTSLSSVERFVASCNPSEVAA